MSHPLIRAVRLEKRYRSGDADLVIFSDLNLPSPAANGWRWWANRARARARCCICWAVWTGQRRVRYTSGRMTFASFAGDELAEFRNRELGFVWQIHSLLAEFTALENVMMPLLIRGQSREEAEPVSMARLDEVGLRNRASHRAGEFRAENSSEWCWPAPWWAIPTSCWPTNPPAASISGPAR